MTEPEPKQSERKLNPTLIALVGGVVFLMLLLWLFAGGRGADQDRLTANQLGNEAPAPASKDKLCASARTYDLVKRDLFRRAAQLRGSDQAAYDSIAAAAVVRMENPVMESESQGAVNCSALLSLDLPPGVAVVGGRRTLTANVDYSIRQAADGSGTVVLLQNADAIVGPLATLARAGAPPEASIGNAVAPEPNVEASESSNVQPGRATSSSGRPSFDCVRAETRGEIAVCSDSGLAALDLNMATQYRRALAGASPAQRRLLQTTRDRFLAYRDRCPNRQCMADAYVGRMREIRDIMEGRWSPTR
jgi:uncharacterized protein YecT (DUF1311 family)